MYTPYCGSTDDTLMFGNLASDKIAMTKDLRLSVGDMIQFTVSWSELVIDNFGCIDVHLA